MNRWMAIVGLAALLAGCTPVVDVSRQATLDALTGRVGQTATAQQLNSDENEAEAAAAARVTEVAQNRQATQAAQSEGDSAAQQATRAAARPILAELPVYGVDPEQGEVAWVQGPLTLEVEGFNDFKGDNAVPGTVVEDFVMSAEITWNTRFGDSGCGFAFRSNGDQNKPTQYMAFMTRFASGHIGFTVLSKGEIVNVLDLFPKGADRQFSAENDSTNQLTIVGRGSRFTIYTNRVLVGEIDPNQAPVLPVFPTPPAPPADPNDPRQKAAYDAAIALQQQETKDIQARYNRQLELFRTENKDFPRGFVAMLAVTQSGKATCTYNNAWLWQIKEP